MGYRDGDELRVRPRPWRGSEEQVVQPTAGANLSPLGTIVAPTAPNPYSAAAMQTIIDDFTAQLNVMIAQMNSMLNS